MRIEENERLSRSCLYDVQRSFYEREGARAWSGGTVPFYITCNPLIADSYAEVVAGFLRDARARGALPEGSRVPILEVGSGSGRFGYLFLRRLQLLLEGSDLGDVAVTLVLTDFTAQKLDEWKQHAWLRPRFDDCSADLAVLDLANVGDPHLQFAGCALSEFVGDSPMVTIANYVLDSIPQDAFAIIDGAPSELLVTVDVPGDDAELSPDRMGDLQITWAPEPLEAAAAYYGDHELDRLIEFYAGALDNSVAVIPTAAIEFVRRLAALGSGPLLALAGDKGYLHFPELLGQAEPTVTLHGGCFSLMVNFDALQRFVEHRGGLALHPPERPASLAVAAYVLAGNGDGGADGDGPAAGTDGQRWPATAAAFRRHVIERGPDDVFALRNALNAGISSMSIDQVTAYVRTYLADSTVFLDCFARLLELANGASDSLRNDIHRLVAQVWDNYFPIGEPTDIALCLGLLLSAIDRHREALPYFDASRSLHAPSVNAAYSAAIAQFALRDLDAALKLANEALDLDPGFSAARRLKATIEHTVS
jgi:tetratricopeptide (TPR) repeat protein